MALVTTPDTTEYVDQRFFIEPLGGPRNPRNYLDRFPDELYNKSVDSRLVKFMYALLGPVGVGALRKNYLQARLLIEDYGLETFDLDGFYGDPFSFGRILEETYSDDPMGLLPQSDWDRIKTKDASYRSRALDFLGAARLGGTREGIHLAARSGLNHDVEVIENYRYLYDQASDDSLGLTKYGSTSLTEEVVILPRRETSTSEIQTISILGEPSGGFFVLQLQYGNSGSTNSFPITPNIPFNADTLTVKAAVETLKAVGPQNTVVTGGPLPDLPISIQFTRALANRDIPSMIPIPSLTGGTLPTVHVDTTRNGVDASNDLTSIPPRDMRHAQTAIERLAPVNSLINFGQAQGISMQVNWDQTQASSEFTEVVRYVTGATSVPWPQRDNIFWIEPQKEHEAQRPIGGGRNHYQGFSNVLNVSCYSEGAIEDPEYGSGQFNPLLYRNNHIGRYSSLQQSFYPILTGLDEVESNPDMILADYPELLTIQGTIENGERSVALINGIYPTDYQTLPNVPPVKYKGSQFWSSTERVEGTDYIEIDLGKPRAVNFLSFEVIGKPIDIAIDYDLLDSAPERLFKPAIIDETSSGTTITFAGSEINPWNPIQLVIHSTLGKVIFTRFVRLALTRRPGEAPFGNDPFSVEIRNLRLGRNVA